MEEETNSVESTEGYEDSEKPKLFRRIKNFLKVNFFKIALLFFALAFALFAFYYLTIYPEQQKKQFDNITSQKKCDDQAINIFNKIRSSTNYINYTYKNHYFTSIDRCYILIHGVGVGQIGLTDELIDVFTNQVIADCESFSTAPQTNFCIYNGSVKVAYNLDYFNEFVKPLMEGK